MNSILIMSLMFLTTGCMLLVIDQHYYHKMTIALLEKKMKDDYEIETRDVYASQAASCGF